MKASATGFKTASVKVVGKTIYMSYMVKDERVDRGNSQLKNRLPSPPYQSTIFPQSHDSEAMIHDFGTFGAGD